MAIENPIHKIRICAESFNSSLTLSCYDTNKLLGVAKKYPRPRIVAELYIRYCIAPNAELKQMVGDLFPEPIRQELWDAAEKFPYGDSPFATDLDTGDSRSIKDAINERWRYYVDADGAFPVCSENDAFLLPFYLEEHIENTPWVVDCDGKEIPEWSEAVKFLSIQSQVKVAVSVSTPLKGHSLQLPVFLASLVKQGKLLPFDPYRFIATGAIEADKLQPVQFTAKYEVLREKYPNAFFVCPKPEEDCPINDNTGIMPIGFSLCDIRNFCFEYIVKKNLERQHNDSGDFFGRTDELAKIHQLLNPLPNCKKKIPLLLGESGIGKTGLALYYGKTCTPYEYPRGCVRLDAGTCSSLPEIFSIFMDNKYYQDEYGFTISPGIEKNEEKFKFLLKHFSQSKERILFILDNLNPEIALDADVKKYFSDYQTSCIDFIATSILCEFNVNTHDIVEKIELKGLAEEDGIALLKHKKNFSSSKEYEAAREIVSFLAGHAWALDVIGESVKQQTNGNYVKKLAELKKSPLQVLTPDSSMIRISHEREIDPVQLLRPVLSCLGPQELAVVQIATCCKPESIYPTWLKSYCIQQLKLSEEDSENIINRLIRAHILSGNQNLFVMHHLTRFVVLEMYKKECCCRGGEFARKILVEIKTRNDINEKAAFTDFAGNIESMSNCNKEPSNEKNIDDMLLQKISVPYHPLMNDFSDVEEKEIYINSFAVIFAKTEKIYDEQKYYLATICDCFKIKVDISDIERLVNSPAQILKKNLTILSSKERQNSWLADAVFLMTQAPDNEQKNIEQTLINFMKTLDWSVLDISKFIEKYLVISRESEPSALWDVIKTIPGNYSWKTILNYRKITFVDLWNDLIEKLADNTFSWEAFNQQMRLQNAILDYELVDPDFKVSPVLEYLIQCKISRWTMTSDIKDLIKNFENFWNEYSKSCREANIVLYIFGEEQIEFPSFSIRFDDDYSAVNQDRWFTSLKKAYDKYESFEGIISSKAKILCQQLRLYQQGKFTISAAKLIEDEQRNQECAKQNEKDAKKTFEFERSGKKYKLDIKVAECHKLPFAINQIQSIIFFRNEWFLYANGLWRSRDRQQWEKVDSFPGKESYCKLNTANNVLFVFNSFNQDVLFSADGQIWQTSKISQKISDINNIFYFCGKWWVSANIYHKYSYIEKGFLWDSKKENPYGTKTIFLESENLAEGWKLSDKFSLTDGQIIKPESLFVTGERIFAIRSWDYSYHGDKHLAESANFIYAESNLRWYTAGCSDELTFCDEPYACTDGEFIQTSKEFFCATDKGLFFSEDGKKWIKTQDNIGYSHCFMLDELLITKSWKYFNIGINRNEFREFDPGFEFDKIIVQNHSFIAYNYEKFFYGEFIITPAITDITKL